MQFVKAHWELILWVGIPLLMVLLSSIANRFADPDNDPATPSPAWVRLVLGIVDFFAAVTKGGKSLNLPGRMTPPSDGKLERPPRNDKGATHLVVLMALAIAGLGAAAVLASGCETARFAARGTQGVIQTAYLQTLEAWPPIDLELQEKIAGDATIPPLERRLKVQEYRERLQAPVQTVLKTILRGLLALDAALKAAEAGLESKWAEALQQLVLAFNQLRKLFDENGIKIPLPALNAKMQPREARDAVAAWWRQTTGMPHTFVPMAYLGGVR